jgi:GT2 family glycosyltransferase
MLRAIKTIPNVGALGGYFNRNSKKSISLSKESFHLVYFGLKNSIDLQSCDVVTSGNLFVKKELLYKFKGFDDFILGSSTEVEFNLFLMENGYKNYFGPSISVKHHKDKEERNNIGIQSKIQNKQIRNTLRLLYAERNYLRFYLKNYGFTVFVQKYIVRLFSITIISLLAFVKQSFFGFKDKSNNTLSLSSKIIQAIYLTACLIDPFIWNVLNFDQTRKCKNSNFLSNKEN